MSFSMTKRCLAGLAFAMVVCGGVIPAFAQTAVQSPPPSFADLVEKLSPAVVNISTTQKVKTVGRAMQIPNLPDSPEFEPFRHFSHITFS